MLPYHFAELAISSRIEVKDQKGNRRRLTRPQRLTLKKEQARTMLPNPFAELAISSRIEGEAI